MDVHPIDTVSERKIAATQALLDMDGPASREFVLVAETGRVQIMRPICYPHPAFYLNPERCGQWKLRVHRRADHLASSDAVNTRIGASMLMY